MTMKLVQAKDTGKQFFLQVWLDDTKKVDGNPDPEYLREWRWGKDNSRAHIRRETRLLAQIELDKINAVTVTLSEEGQTL